MGAGHAYSVRWTEKARQDLFAIGDYIARDNPTAASRFTSALMARTAVLADTPRIGRMVPEVARGDVRELICGNYRIVYRLLETEGRGSSVIHDAAAWTAALLQHEAGSARHG